MSRAVEFQDLGGGPGGAANPAALVAGFTSFAPLLLGGVPFAEFYVFAKLAKGAPERW